MKCYKTNSQLLGLATLSLPSPLPWLLCPLGPLSPHLDPLPISPPEENWQPTEVPSLQSRDWCVLPPTMSNLSSLSLSLLICEMGVWTIDLLRFCIALQSDFMALLDGFGLWVNYSPPSSLPASELEKLG